LADRVSRFTQDSQPTKETMADPAQPLPSRAERVRQARKDFKFQRFLARSFGEKVNHTVDDVILDGYAWRGYVHVTGVRPRHPN
jgi:hypothetical protein